MLEDRTLLSPYLVTTTADSGFGLLRDAIAQVNADTSHTLYPSPSNSSVDEIDFAITAASNTGGGWITSPAGADAANPTLTGPANFGFNARYHSGDTVPTGSTQFQFPAANLTF